MYILRYKALAVLLLLLLAMAPALAQNVVYQGETTPLAVVNVPGETYEWELYNDGTVNFAVVPGNCPVTSAIFVGGNVGASINVQWLQPGFYFFKVTARDAANCTNNIKVGMIEVKPALPTAIITPPADICVGQTASLEVTLTGVGPWELTYTDGTNFWTETGINTTTYLLRVSPIVTSQYWIAEVKDVNGTNSVPSDKVTLNVNPKPVSSTIYQHDPK